MSYQVLARKWRPRRFESLVGQRHVVQALTNALTQQRLHHAYLFTGTRGVGKTTLARIIAKCMNCETGITATPCDQCQACQEIDAGRFVDLIEVDAASRTKVEDTRELLDNVLYSPTKGRYKIYLIDEVHMLSGHSFNALLKTLEEPPLHVKFLLATTDPQKLPATVLSRCLQFHLKNLTIEQISGHLADVLTQEKIPFETEALQRLARAAHGSVRDSLSLLDQAIAFGDKNVTTSIVKSLLGSIESHHLSNILKALIANDGQALLSIVAHIAEQGADFMMALGELIAFIHQISILQAIPQATSSLWDDPEAARELAPQLTSEETQLYYQICLTGQKDLPLAPTPRSGFEMLLLRMLAFRPITTQTQILTPQSIVAAPKVAQTLMQTQRPSSAADITPSPQKPVTQTQKLTPAASSAKSNPSQADNLAKPSSDWPIILEALSVSSPTRAFASHCTLQSLTDTTITLSLNPKHAPLYNDMQHKRLSEALNIYFNKSMYLIVNLEESHENSPAKQQANIQQQKHLVAENSLKQHDTLQAIVKTFDATIVTESISLTDK